MYRIADYLGTTWFQLKWMLMSPKKRYAYMWNRTRNSIYRV